jgi:hypothetical protein
VTNKPDATDSIQQQLDHAKEAEKALAGIAVLDAHAVAACTLSKADFVESVYFEVLDTCRALASEGQYVDIKKIVLELRARKSSADPAMIATLAAESPNPEDCEHFTDIVRRMSQVRQVRKILDKAIDELTSSAEPDPIAVADKAEQKIAKVRDQNTTIRKVQIVTLDELERDFPQEREPVLDGLIRVGSVMNVIAAPKVGKSFIASNLAFRLACSDEFLGFPIVRRGKTLVVDNELHQETLASRYRNTREAIGVPADRRNMIEFLPLRGVQCDIRGLRQLLARKQPGEYSAIILDAFYKFIPFGVSENDNAQMSGIYTQLEAMANELNTAIIVIHHSSKGSQGDKALSDIGAGAGVISRSVDAHVVIRPHEQEGYCVMEALVRSFRQPVARTIKFDYPVWNLIEDVDAKVAQPKAPGAGKREMDNAEADRVVRDYLSSTSDPKTEADICQATGLNKGKVVQSLQRIGATILENFKNKYGKNTVKWGLVSSSNIENGSNWLG